MKRIIGIPFSKKKVKGEKQEKEEGEKEDPLSSSRPQKPPPPALSDMLTRTDAKVEELDKKAQQCETELRKISARLRTLPEGSVKNGLRSKAQALLQRKKRFELQAESFRQQSFNIDQTTAALQSAKDTVTVVKVMKKGVKDLKKEQKKVDIESVEDLHDELEQLFEASENVQDVLASNLNMPEIDDKELQDQLDALGDEFVADNDTSYLDDAELASLSLAKGMGGGVSNFAGPIGGIDNKGGPISAKAKEETPPTIEDKPEIVELPPQNPLDVNDILFDSSKFTH